MTDHYELQCAQWAERICTLSPNDLQRKLPELHRHGDCLTLWHFDRRISIDLWNGQLRCISDNKPLGLIYNST